MEKNHRKYDLKNIVLSSILSITTLCSQGCTNGTWYLFGKEINKDPVTKKLIIREYKQEYEKKVDNVDEYLIDLNIRTNKQRHSGMNLGIFYYPDRYN